jgi:ribosomal protein S18 acetylase RimI-like enzyme
VIREALPEDFGAVREVARAGWTHAYSGIVPEEVQREFLEVAYSEQSLQRRMDRGVLLVAVLEGEVLGFANLHAGSGDEVELAALYVLPEHHGRGIGTRLLEEGLTRFPRARRCALEVVRENEDALRFYEARGFRTMGESVWRFPGGEAVELRMVRELR